MAQEQTSLSLSSLLSLSLSSSLLLAEPPRAPRNWKPIDARKFGYDEAPARTPTTCKSMSIITFDLAQIDTSLSVI